MSNRGTFGWKGTGKRALEFPAGDGVAAAPTGRARLRYNEATGFIEVSFSGSSYTPMATGSGTSPWEESSPGFITLVTVTDTIVLGPVGAVPGSGSSSILWLGVTSTETRGIVQRMDAEALSNEAELVFDATGVGPVMSLKTAGGGVVRIKADAPVLNRLGEGIVLHAGIAAPYTINPNVEPLFLRFTTSDATQRDVNLPAF